MSFAIINSIRIVQEKQLYPILNKKNQLPLVIDLIVIAGTLTLAGLKFGKVWNFGLPGDKSSLATGLAIGCTVIGSTALGSTMIVATILKHRTSERVQHDLAGRNASLRPEQATGLQSVTTQVDGQHEPILFPTVQPEAPSSSPPPVTVAIAPPKMTPTPQSDIPQDKIEQIKREISSAPVARVSLFEWTCIHQICNGIFLGDKDACMFALQDPNPNKISIVITLCTTVEISTGVSDTKLHEIPMPTDHGKIFNNGAQWLYLGNFIDEPSSWKQLINNCTYGRAICSFKEPDLFAQPLPDKRSEWCRFAFTQLDRAFIAGQDGETKNILVHCRGGISRSATLLAAYLINRFDVTTEQALNFLRSKRNCVNSKFVEQLKEYEQDLRAERLKK